MFEAIQSKLKPIIVIPENQKIKEKLIDDQSDYVFLERNHELYAYVYTKEVQYDANWEEIQSYANPIEELVIFHEGKDLSFPFIFQVLGQPIILVKDRNSKLIGYIHREDILIELLKRENQNGDFIKLLLTSIPLGMFIVDRDNKIVNYNDSGLKMIRSQKEDVLGADARFIFSEEHLNSVFLTGKTMLNQIHITDEMGVLVDYSPVMVRDGEKEKVDGAVIIVQDLPMVEEMAVEMDFVKNLNHDLNAILATIYDEILIVNGEGELIRHSENYISDFWRIDLKELIGRSLLDLEQAGLFTPSVTRLVMEKREKVSVVQETDSGLKILSIGNPIFNEDGELLRIVIASRDITEHTKLKSELEKTKEKSDKYKEELNHLKNKESPSDRIIYSSQKMEKIIMQIEKLAKFSSTVLIQGESGVGKELIAKEVHKRGSRSKNTFLTINCGAIPENLLESELFGYTKGAFTGADNNGKIGYFQRANGGILFLDEIGEISQQLQVKLLRVLQENEVVPIGSTDPVPIDVQIIAATNKNLEKMVEEGTFREDLYYRINVIPLNIPPLRERPEDVPLLAHHFIQKLNKKYQKKYHFSPDALSLLELYAWPGNIRELQNLIERLFITAEDDVITSDVVSQFLRFDVSGKSKPMITGIMPLQKAQEYVEEQLITLAIQQYKTTTKAARALGISQSAVSRKYKKIQERKNQSRPV